MSQLLNISKKKKIKKKLLIVILSNREPIGFK